MRDLKRDTGQISRSNLILQLIPRIIFTRCSNKKKQKPNPLFYSIIITPADPEPPRSSPQNYERGQMRGNRQSSTRQNRRFLCSPVENTLQSTFCFELRSEQRQQRPQDEITRHIGDESHGILWYVLSGTSTSCFHAAQVRFPHFYGLTWN